MNGRMTDEEQAALHLVRSIFAPADETIVRMRKGGTTFGEIAQRLNADGMAGYHGGSWTPATVVERWVRIVDRFDGWLA